MSQFVTYFEHPRINNQRTGIEISNDGKLLFLGGEKGEIFVHSLGESNQ